MEIQEVLGKGPPDTVMAIWEQRVSGYCMRLTIDDMIAIGTTVAARYTERSTFSAPAFGHAPTGKNYTLVAME